MSKPQVFILESLKFEDEEKRREGEVLYRALQMMGKKPIYRYVRTLAEFDHFLDEFDDSEYRYLHLSCHGSRTGIQTTLEPVSTAKLGEMLGSVLEKRRLFLSACLATTQDLAEKIFEACECYSVVGPRDSIYFDDSVVFWMAFYHLMFKEDTRAMKLAVLKKTLKVCADLTGDRMNLFNRGEEGATIYTPFGPAKALKRRAPA